MALQTRETCYNNESSSGCRNPSSVAHRASGGVENTTLNPATIQNGAASSEVSMDDLIQGQLSFADVLELEILEARESGLYEVFEAMSDALRRMRESGELESLNAYLARGALKNGVKPVDLNLDSHIDQFARHYAFLKAKSQNRADTSRFRQPVLTRSQGNCEVCGLWCSAIMHLHHVWPVSKGGASTLRNLIGLCPNCHAFTHRLKESVDGDKERELCYQLCDYASEIGSGLLISLSAARIVYDGKKWREVKSEIEYLQTAYLALRDSLCVTYSQFEQSFRGAT